MRVPANAPYSVQIVEPGVVAIFRRGTEEILGTITRQSKNRWSACDYDGQPITPKLGSLTSATAAINAVLFKARHRKETLDAYH